MKTIACVLVSCGMATLLAAAPPELLRYQARLADDAGVPLIGNHDVTLRIFDVQTGGVALWSEGPRSVTLVNGVLDVLLGESIPLPSSVFTGAERWLEVTVDGAVLAPRQRLASSAFAHVADRLDTMTMGDVLAAGADTLDDAYDEGGAGSGRTINADAGAVEIDGPDGLRIQGRLEAMCSLPYVATGCALKVMENTGRVGISVDASDPAFLFHVNTGGSRDFLVDDTGDVAIGTATSSGNPLFIDAGGGVLVTSAGNVGVGTTTPADLLHARGDAPHLSLDINSASLEDFVELRFRRDGTVESKVYWSKADGKLYLDNDGAGGLSIDSGGVVEVGSTLSLTPGGNLGSGTAPVANRVYPDSVVKGWARTNTAGAVQAGFNLTVSKGGTGIYDYSFRTPMASSPYAVVVTVNVLVPGLSAFVRNGSEDVNGFQVRTVLSNNTLGDVGHTVVVLGNQ